MTDYYVYPSAAGNNDGGGDGAANDPTDADNWTDAWTTIQSAFTNAAAGDIVYCKGTETYADATTRTFGNSGTHAAGFIKFIGCNATTGAIDGSYYVLDVNGQDCVGLTVNGQDFIWLENIRVTNTGGTTKDCMIGGGSSATGWVVVHCSFDNSNRHGFSDGSVVFSYSLFYRCVFYANDGSGLSGSAVTTIFAFCRFYDNVAGDGLTACYSHLLGCLIYDNGDDGIDMSPGAVMVNCVVDGNADDGIYQNGGTSLWLNLLLGCRITNQTAEDDDSGLNCNSKVVVSGWCYFDDNGNAAADNIINATVHYALPVDNGTASSNLEDTQASEGYTDVTTEDEHDFNLTSSANYRRQAITIPET